MEAFLAYLGAWWDKVNIWVLIGLSGQLLFASRFIVQWIASERAKKVVIPTAFWYMSLGGSLIVLAYGIHDKDLVVTLGQLPGSVVYVRNLMLMRAARRRELAGAPPRVDAPSA